jgi:hypothetical protein
VIGLNRAGLKRAGPSRARAGPGRAARLDIYRRGAPAVKQTFNSPEPSSLECPIPTESLGR